MRMPHLALLVLLPASFVCVASAEDAPEPEWPSAEARTMRADHAPAPYTAEQIRQGCRTGRKITWRHSPIGQPSFQQTFVFEESTDEGTRLAVTTYDMEGNRKGETQRAESKWPELQAHASFPVGMTRIQEEDQETPMGIHACFLYIVTTPDGRVSRFWFAKALPGPPIRMESRKDGRMLHAMTMTANSYPPAPAPVAAPDADGDAGGNANGD